VDLPPTWNKTRTNDPHSATSQFFINVSDNDFLNFTAEAGNGWGYAVFGEVTEGLEVVQKIEKVTTGAMGHYRDVPTEPVVIESVNGIEFLSGVELMRHIKVPPVHGEQTNLKGGRFVSIFDSNLFFSKEC